MAVLLALCATACYGVSNFLGPLISRDAPTYVVLMAGQVVALVASAAVLVFTAASLPGAGTATAGVVTGLGNAVGLIGFYRAASLGPLSIVAPIGATAAIVPVTLGLIEGEPASALRLAGIALAIAGVALAARRPPAEVDEPDDRRGAVLWAVIGAGGFGVFLASIDRASADGVFWALGLSRVSLLLVLGVVALLIGETLRAPARDLPKLAAPGVLLFTGTLTYAAATQEGDLSVVAVLGSLFPLVTVGLAFAFLGERLSRIQSAGVVGALVGVVLLSAQ